MRNEVVTLLGESVYVCMCSHLTLVFPHFPHILPVQLLTDTLPLSPPSHRSRLIAIWLIAIWLSTIWLRHQDWVGHSHRLSDSAVALWPALTARHHQSNRRSTCTQVSQHDLSRCFRHPCQRSTETDRTGSGAGLPSTQHTYWQL